jgi:hypothetical protein
VTDPIEGQVTDNFDNKLKKYILNATISRVKIYRYARNSP